MYQHSLITVFDLFLNKTLIFTDFNYAATENCDGLKAVRDQKKCFTWLFINFTVNKKREAQRLIV